MRTSLQTKTETLTNKSLDNLAFEIESLNSNLEDLVQALNRHDDFNNWSYADSLASIANSLVKMNSIENTKVKKESKSKKNPFNWQNGKGFTFRLVDIKPFDNQGSSDAKLKFEVRVNSVVDTYYSTYLNPTAEAENGYLSHYFDGEGHWENLMTTINEYTWGDIAEKYIIGKS